VSDDPAQVEAVMICPFPAIEYHTPGVVIEVPQDVAPTGSVVALLVLTVTDDPHVMEIAPEQ
jgi:hypothetical protein